MRSTLDKLLSGIGLAIAAVLAVATALLFWASAFIGDQVKQQFGDQHITMPAAAALTTQDMKDNLSQYSGTPLDSGPKAKAYADHYILAHMNESSGGKTYSEISSEYMKAAKTAPDAEATKALGELRQSLFMGNTLRGLLLYGYAFATMGTIAGYAAWAALLGTLVMLALGLLGLRHARQVAAERDTVAPTRV